MAANRSIHDRLIDLRREFHSHPEPGWLEFETTARIVTELQRIGVDELYVGADIYDSDDRMGVPDQAVVDRWRSRAMARGIDEDVLADMGDGVTGALGVIRGGPGPTVGLRVDIDALRIVESEDADHRPAAKQFRSTTEESMHACGHDAHATIGLGVAEAVNRAEFGGTLKVFFQPAEEGARGGHAVAGSRHLADVDDLIALHVGLGHPTGEVVAGCEKILATSKLEVEFTGEAAHAGRAPNEGSNAVLAAASAIQNVHAIPRHADGATRINVGLVSGGDAINIVPSSAGIAIDIRGETTELMEYVRERAVRICRRAGEMYGCSVAVETIGQAPRVDSDPELSEYVYRAARANPRVTTPLRRSDFGASEDATHLMRRVKDEGGRATYAIVGTDHPGEHHTPRFDIDEQSLTIGVEVIAETILELGDHSENGSA
ncbi:MAG: amidohydrolase [Salinigranum sp.]